MICVIVENRIMTNIMLNIIGMHNIANLHMPLTQGVIRMWPRAENEHVVILNVMKGFSVSADARSPSSMEHGVVFRHGT